MKESPKILYLVNIPSPYRVSFFNEFGKNCDLTVLFERESSEDRETSWHDYNFQNFKGIFLKSFKLQNNKSICLDFIKYIKENKYDHIIVGGYATPTGALFIQYLNMKKIPFILNIDGGMIKEHENKFIEIIKKHFISSASDWLSTGEIGSKYLEYYGANKKNIFIYPFTTLKKEDLLENLLDDVEKSNLRNDLGLKGSRIVLTVGQFIHRKGFDVLIKAASLISPDTSIYFVGGSPNEEYLELIETLQLNNIHFLGFRSKEEILKIYQASDIFILPTREDIWGLVINEAMANGLPVITTDKCVAGLELIKNYDNGFIVPVESIDELSMRINEIFENDELLIKMSEQSLKKIQKYTIENMALETHAILNRLEKDNLYVE